MPRHKSQKEYFKAFFLDYLREGNHEKKIKELDSDPCWTESRSIWGRLAKRHAGHNSEANRKKVYNRWRTKRLSLRRQVIDALGLPAAGEREEGAGQEPLPSTSGQSAKTAWPGFEKVLNLTVTQSSRAADAVVVSRATSMRRRCGCCCLVAVLSLLPLLVGLLYASSCYKEVLDTESVKNQIFTIFESQKTAANELESSTKVGDSSFGSVPKDKPPESTEAGEGNLLTIDVLEEHLQGFLDFIANHKATTHEDQERALAAFRPHINKMIKLLQLFSNQLTFQINSLKSTAHGDRVHLIINDIDAGSSAGFLRDTDEAGILLADGKVAFGHWLSQKFISREDLDRRLAALSKDDTGKPAVAVAAIIAESRAADGFDAGSFNGGALRISAPCTVCGGILTEADVLKLIQAEIGIYDADKTGKADYALESAGGSVIIVRFSRTYQLRTIQTSVFGIPLWYTYNSPRVVIQSGMQPGECWPFTGTQGYVVVQLSRKILVTEVSIEHIPKALAPNGMIDSAPKDCEIWGRENEMDLVGMFLGAFAYSSDGRPLQTFKVENSMAVSFRFVELKINSNHGNDHYTCLYRFRVHGYVDPNYTGSA